MHEIDSVASFVAVVTTGFVRQTTLVAVLCQRRKHEKDSSQLSRTLSVMIWRSDATRTRFIRISGFMNVYKTSII